MSGKNMYTWTPEDMWRVLFIALFVMMNNENNSLICGIVTKENTV